MPQILNWFLATYFRCTKSFWRLSCFIFYTNWTVIFMYGYSRVHLYVFISTHLCVIQSFILLNNIENRRIYRDVAKVLPAILWLKIDTNNSSSAWRKIQEHGLTCRLLIHSNDVIMGAIASQITSLTIVYSIVYSDADQRKHQNSAPLAFVRTNVQLRGKCFRLMTPSCSLLLSNTLCNESKVCPWLLIS